MKSNLSEYKQRINEKVRGLFCDWVDEVVKHSIKQVEDLINDAKKTFERVKELEAIIAHREAEEAYAKVQKEAAIAYANRPWKEPSVPISSLTLSTRIQTLFDQEGFQSIGDIIDKTEDDLSAIRDFGKGSLAILKNELAKHGYALRSVEHPFVSKRQQIK
jgi:DNA-directed RNA polymerase alpha subunit